MHGCKPQWGGHAAARHAQLPALHPQRLLVGSTPWGGLTEAAPSTHLPAEPVRPGPFLCTRPATAGPARPGWRLPPAAPRRLPPAAPAPPPWRRQPRRPRHPGRAWGRARGRGPQRAGSWPRPAAPGGGCSRPPCRGWRGKGAAAQWDGSCHGAGTLPGTAGCAAPLCNCRPHCAPVLRDVEQPLRGWRRQRGRQAGPVGAARRQLGHDCVCDAGGTAVLRHGASHGRHAALPGRKHSRAGGQGLDRHEQEHARQRRRTLPLGGRAAAAAAIRAAHRSCGAG